MASLYRSDHRGLWTFGFEGWATSYNAPVVRYENQPLPARPRIALIANDAIGNFVMATPVLQLLRRERNPNAIVFFGGTRTAELQDASDLIDTSHHLHGADPGSIRQMLAPDPPFDLVVNLESTPLSKTAAGLLCSDHTLVAGPCIGHGGRGELRFANDSRGDLWRDHQWARPNLAADYPFLRSGFISEIFARLLYLEGELPGYKVPIESPPSPTPNVLIATAASLPEKLWPAENWQDLLGRIRAVGLTVGLLGAAPSAQQTLWTGGEAEDSLIGEGLAEDWRGKLTLPQVVGALARSKAVVTLDNGILHLAIAANVPTVGLYRHGIHHLWAPPSHVLDVLTAGENVPVSALNVDRVFEALEKRLG